MQSEGKKKILIADDSETFVMYMCILLNRMGFSVIPADNGLEAMRLLKLTTPDMVILDVNMPVLDGVGALQHIRETEDLSHIPVMMVSVDASRETVGRCRDLGCTCYLTKPLKVDELHDALQEHMFSKQGWRRKRIRINVTTRVTVAHGGDTHELYTEALSTGGIYVRKREPLPVGSEVGVTLPLDGRTLSLTGRVIYVKGIFGEMFKVPPGMGIEFKDVSEDDLTHLSDYISRSLAGDILESQEECVIRADGEQGASHVV